MLIPAALLLLSAPALAAVSQMTQAPEWTITSFTRICTANSTSCTFSFGVDTHMGNMTTPCSYNVTASPPQPASRTDYVGRKCGPYTVSSGWSGFFGPGNGFTTLSVTDQTSIVFPAYTDKELMNQTAVKPDKAYAPQALPHK